MPYFLFFLILTACSVGGPMREDHPAKNYKMGPHPESWENIQTEDADKSKHYNFFRNPKTGATFWVNSICDRYKDSKLFDLTEQLKAPLQNVEVLSSEEKSLDGRASLWTRLKAQVDGVDVENYFVVIRKNSCIFDFSMSSIKKIKDDDLNDFIKWVNGFSYQGD